MAKLNVSIVEIKQSVASIQNEYRLTCGAMAAKAVIFAVKSCGSEEKIVRRRRNDEYCDRIDSCRRKSWPLGLLLPVLLRFI